MLRPARPAIMGRLRLLLALLALLSPARSACPPASSVTALGPNAGEVSPGSLQAELAVALGADLDVEFRFLPLDPSVPLDVHFVSDRSNGGDWAGGGALAGRLAADWSALAAAHGDLRFGLAACSGAALEAVFGLRPFGGAAEVAQAAAAVAPAAARAAPTPQTSSGAARRPARSSLPAAADAAQRGGARAVAGGARRLLVIRFDGFPGAAGAAAWAAGAEGLRARACGRWCWRRGRAGPPPWASGRRRAAGGGRRGGALLAAVAATRGAPGAGVAVRVASDPRGIALASPARGRAAGAGRWCWTRRRRGGLPRDARPAGRGARRRAAAVGRGAAPAEALLVVGGPFAPNATVRVRATAALDTSCSEEAVPLRRGGAPGVPGVCELPLRNWCVDGRFQPAMGNVLLAAGCLRDNNTGLTSADKRFLPSDLVFSSTPGAFSGSIAKETGPLDVYKTASVSGFPRLAVVRTAGTAAGAAGSMFFAQRVPFRRGFQVVFNYTMIAETVSSPTSGTRRIAPMPADLCAGVALVLHGNAAAGSSGRRAGVGYGGVPRSVAVELDCGRDAAAGDPDANHASVHLNGDPAEGPALARASWEPAPYPGFPLRAAASGAPALQDTPAGDYPGPHAGVADGALVAPFRWTVPFFNWMPNEEVLLVTQSFTPFRCGYQLAGNQVVVTYHAVGGVLTVDFNGRRLLAAPVDLEAALGSPADGAMYVGLTAAVRGTADASRAGTTFAVDATHFSVLSGGNYYDEAVDPRPFNLAPPVDVVRGPAGPVAAGAPVTLTVARSLLYRGADWSWSTPSDGDGSAPSLTYRCVESCAPGAPSAPQRAALSASPGARGAYSADLGALPPGRYQALTADSAAEFEVAAGGRPSAAESYAFLSEAPKAATSVPRRIAFGVVWRDAAGGLAAPDPSALAAALEADGGGPAPPLAGPRASSPPASTRYPRPPRARAALTPAAGRGGAPAGGFALRLSYGGAALPRAPSASPSPLPLPLPSPPLREPLPSHPRRLLAPVPTPTPGPPRPRPRLGGRAPVAGRALWVALAPPEGVFPPAGAAPALLADVSCHPPERSLVNLTRFSVFEDAPPPWPLYWLALNATAAGACNATVGGAAGAPRGVFSITVLPGAVDALRSRLEGGGPAALPLLLAGPDANATLRFCAADAYGNAVARRSPRRSPPCSSTPPRRAAGGAGGGGGGRRLRAAARAGAAGQYALELRLGGAPLRAPWLPRGASVFVDGPPCSTPALLCPTGPAPPTPPPAPPAASASTAPRRPTGARAPPAVAAGGAGGGFAARVRARATAEATAADASGEPLARVALFGGGAAAAEAGRQGRRRWGRGRGAVRGAAGGPRAGAGPGRLSAAVALALAAAEGAPRGLTGALLAPALGPVEVALRAAVPPDRGVGVRARRDPLRAGRGGAARRAARALAPGWRVGCPPPPPSPSPSPAETPFLSPSPTPSPSPSPAAGPLPSPGAGNGTEARNASGPRPCAGGAGANPTTDCGAGDPPPLQADVRASEPATPGGGGGGAAAGGVLGTAAAVAALACVAAARRRRARRARREYESLLARGAEGAREGPPAPSEAGDREGPAGAAEWEPNPSYPSGDGGGEGGEGSWEGNPSYPPRAGTATPREAPS
eukprot:tig00001177_g7358.t1